VTFRWEEYLVLAKELSQKGGEAATTAISRAYYAAYQIARRHKGSKGAVATQSGSHGAVWRALKEAATETGAKRETRDGTFSNIAAKPIMTTRCSA
jgi:hypothetical protein